MYNVLCVWFLNRAGDDEAMRMAVIILMHNIHRKEYTRKEMEVFPGIIYRNIVLAVQTLAKAMMKLEIQYEKEENRVEHLSVHYYS